jgi:hypothetical protein
MSERQILPPPPLPHVPLLNIDFTFSRTLTHTQIFFFVIASKISKVREKRAYKETVC